MMNISFQQSDLMQSPQGYKLENYSTELRSFQQSDLMQSPQGLHLKPLPSIPLRTDLRGTVNLWLQIDQIFRHKSLKPSSALHRKTQRNHQHFSHFARLAQRKKTISN